jgi:hypothetical protein
LVRLTSAAGCAASPPAVTRIPASGSRSTPIAYVDTTPSVVAACFSTGRMPAALSRTPIVALNFHEITAEHRSEVLRSLRHVAALGPRFDPDESDPIDGPRVFVAFSDGMRDAALFGAEKCASLGLTAYFFPLFDHDDRT